MKKIIFFTLSFTLLFSLWQIVSGILLTLLYTPNVERVWENSANLPSEIMLTSSGHSTLIGMSIALLSAVMAYFIARKIPKKKQNYAE